jgi:diacylglycerol kinase (ATP)
VGSSPTAGTRFSTEELGRQPRVAQSNTLILVNPSAGGGRAARIHPILYGYFRDTNCKVDFAVAKSAENFRAIAREAVGAGYQNIVALGGDGAFHQLVNACLGADVNLGLIPGGTGNDIAASLGIPRDPIEAAHALTDAVPKPVDLVQVRCTPNDLAADGAASTASEAFIGAGGVGLDAEAANLANTRFRKWPGGSRYIVGALAAWRSADLEMEVEVDEVKWSGKAMLVAVANGPRYGSGIQIAPEAQMDDGLLDVVIVKEVSWTRLIEALPIVMTGNIRWPEVVRFTGRKCVIRAEKSVLVHGDGEVLGRSPARFEILPKAVRILLAS